MNTIHELITDESLKRLMLDLSETGHVFKSEAQFQFDLAWKLQELLNRENCTDHPKVCLEYLSACQTEGGKTRRFFTDIIVRDDQGRFIPIELKYKTKRTGKTDDPFDDFATHGATDLGRFDYLWDVHRIQLLKSQEQQGYTFSPELKTFCGGFAVLLTNEQKYWKVTRETLRTRNEDPLYTEFCIGDGESLSGELNWKNRGCGTCIEDTWRNVPIRLDREYTCNWVDYPVKNNTEFRFLILTVEA